MMAPYIIHVVILFMTVMFASCDTLSDMVVIRATSDSSRSVATSWSATITVEQNYVDNGDITFWTRSYCYEGECYFPGPTIEVVPGDSFTLTLVNSLDDNPTGEDTTRNSMHSPNTVNVHTHGLHIDPDVDTVFISAAPGETLVYNYEIPSDHAPGLYWHHDHVHGGSALRVMGGLVGAVIVRPSGSEGIPSSITDANEHVLVLHTMAVGQEKDNNGYVSQACSNSATCDIDTQPPDCTSANYASSTTFSPFRQYSYRELSAATGSELDPTVTLANLGTYTTSGSWSYYENELMTTFTNGQFEPTLTVDSGEVVTFRVVHAGGGEELKIKYVGSCTFQVISLDGIYLDEARTMTSSDTTYLMAGSRIDVQMSCTGGGGGLNAANAHSSQAIITVAVSGSTQTHDFTTTAELAAISRPNYLSDLTEATVDISYSNHVSQGSRPTSECGGSDLFWWGAGSDCSAVAPWGSEQPSSTSEDCPFGFFVGPRGDDPTTYEDAYKLVTYTGDGSTDGEVNEWSLYGLGRSKHPLHLHVFHFQIISFECVDGSANCDISDMEEWMTVGDWRDVLPTFEARLVVRFRAMDFPGETVLHCHFLRHEDLGMMDTVLVVDGYRPGPSPEPTPKPTYSPFHSPTPHPVPSPSKHPIPSPTSQPTKHPVPSPSKYPIPSPTSQPTKHPVPSPSKYPIPSPTSQPTYEPTHDPTPRPTTKPSFNPSAQPTPNPTHTFSPTTGTPSPTKRPIPQPTLLPSTSKPSFKPTLFPTLLPSLSDTITLSVMIVLSADDESTDEDEVSLLSLIANQTDVDESNIKNFDVEYTARRRQLLSGTWAVTFDIVISLASTSSSTASAFESFVESALSASSFENKVKKSVSSVLSVNAVVATLETRNPSPVPTIKSGGSGGDDDDIVAANFTFLLAGAGIVMLICCGCCFFVFRYFRNNEYEKHGEDETPSFNWRSSFGRNSGGGGGFKKNEQNNRPAKVGKTASGFELNKSPVEFNWRSSFGRNKKKDQEELIREMTKTSFNNQGGAGSDGTEPIRKTSLIRTSFNPMMPNKAKFPLPPPPPPGKRSSNHVATH